MRTPPSLSPDHLREFMARDRRRLEQLKRDHWVEQRRVGGPLVTLRVGHALYEHARRTLPGFPDEKMRDQDLRDHVALKQKIDRAADAFALR